MCSAPEGSDGPARADGSPAPSEFELTWGADATAGDDVTPVESPAPADAGGPRPPIVAGGNLLGDFRLLSVIGRGGMGVVYEAEQISLGRRVAIKVLAPHLGVSKDIVQRFRREAEAGGRQQHPGIVAIHAVGEQDGVYFIAQELIEGGRTLADQLDTIRAAGEPPREYFRQMAQLFVEVAEALQSAHASGVIHRDIKPSNILLTRHGRAKVGDFGLAKLENALALSRTGLFEGTPYYVSPEQVAGCRAGVDHRTDIYSLGVTLYETLTLVRPFTGDTSAEVLRKVLQDEPADPRCLNPRIPRDLAVICQKAMEREPGARYASMADLAADLERWLAGEAIVARPVGAMTRSFKWIRRHRPLAAALAGAIVVAGVYSAFFLVRDQRSARAFRVLADEAAAAAQKGAWGEAIDKTVRAISLRPHDPVMRDRHQLYLQQKELAAVRAERDEKEQALRRSDGLRLVSESTQVLKHDPALALLLALEAVKRYPSLAARNALSEGLARNREERTLFFRRYPFLPDVQMTEITNHAFLAVSRDGGKLLTSSFDDSPRIWDAHSGEELFTLRALRASGGGYRTVHYGDFSPDSRIVALPDYHGEQLVWDAETGRQAFSLRGHTAGVHFLEFSPDGRRIATTCSDSLVRLWDARDGTLLQVLRGHNQAPIRVHFRPDGRRLVTASLDSTARVWDVETGAPLLVLRGHEDRLRTARFSPDGGTVVTASDDLTLRFWDGETGELQRIIRSPGSPFIAVYEIVYSPDGSLVTATWGDAVVRIWRVATGEEAFALRGHEGITRAVAFSPDGTRIVTAAFDNTARIWDARTGRELAVLRGHVDFLHHVAFDPAGRRVYTIAQDATVRFWNAETASRRDPCVTGRLETFAFDQGSCVSPDGRRELVRDQLPTMLTIRSRVPGGGHAIPLHHEEVVSGGRFSTDGGLVATGTRVDETGIAKIWDAVSGELKETLRMSGGVLVGAHFLDRRTLITASGDGTVRIWDWETGREQVAYRGHVRWALAFAYSDDRSKLVTASSDGTARVWDAASGKALAVLKGHEDHVLTAAFSPDASHVATTSRDRTARLWDAATGEELLTFEIASGDRAGIAGFSPDGVDVVYRAPDGTTLSRPVDVLRAAERRKPRDLTPAEKARFSVWDSGEEEAYALVQKLFDELILSSEVVARIDQDPSLRDDVRRAARRFAAIHEDSEEMLRRTAAIIDGDPASTPAARERARRMSAAAATLAAGRLLPSP